MKRRVRAAALLMGALLAPAMLSPRRLPAQANERGAAALGSVLEGLGTTGRVLTVAAHPDDEDTQFIAWLTRGRHVETAYLSLTRGDGGQNLIGNELGEALGAIRTQELLSARRIDGGRQYFTRAYDFGFSKNAEETYQHWPKDSILGDVIRVVRAFRPHVMVAFFSGTPRDGHGHHQVSGLLAREAYELAADTVRFPVWGYGPAWTPSKFYRSARQNMAGASLRMNVGEYDALLGRSYSEIADDSRSQHKSQGFGRLQRKGVVIDGIVRETARVGPADSTKEVTLFEGVDTTWARLRSRLVSDSAKIWLDSATRYMASAKSLYRAEDPTPTVQPLARAVYALRRAQRGLSAPPSLTTFSFGRPPVLQRTGNGIVDADVWDALALTLARAEQALVLAAGVAVEATAPRATLPVREAVKKNVNDSLPVTITMFNRGRTSVRFIGAQAYAREVPASDSGRMVAPDSAVSVERFAVSTNITMPWWRYNGRQGTDWFQTPIDSRDESQQEERSAATARALLQVGGTNLTLNVPIVNRFADPIKGDQQVPLAAVPGVMIGLENGTEYIRAGVPVERELRVYVQSAYPHDANVTVKLDVPKGLVADSAERKRTLIPGVPMVVSFRLRGNVPPGKHELGASVIHEGTIAALGYYTVAYDHIQPQRMYGMSGMYLSAVNVKLPPRARVGYIPGAGDVGIEALRQLDVAVEKLEPSAIAGTDLSRFTAIVVGPRAYESSDVLVKQNPRLLNYANNGGTLVVQYGAQDMSRYPVTPYPLQWTRPAARVTLETAPVNVLKPTSPLLTTPNKIGDDDWKSWVQERATYMPSTIDSHYTPLLSMNDPEEPENKGALLVTPLGKGQYVYVTLALFRQLPAGVPGAARILLNLVNGTATPVQPKM